MKRKPLNIRPLNAPRPVRVVEAPDGAPTSINGRQVERIADRWRIDDHVERGLPWSPIYERTHLHPDPERIREGWWTTGENAHRHGMGAWLRYHYPDLWRRAVEQWPEMKV